MILPLEDNVDRRLYVTSMNHRFKEQVKTRVNSPTRLGDFALFSLVMLSFLAGRSFDLQAQEFSSFDPIYMEQLGAPNMSETPIFSTPNFESQGFDYNYGAFEGAFLQPQAIPFDNDYGVSVPRTIESNFVGSDGSSYTILGDVTNAFNFGDGRFDSIPFLNEGSNINRKPLPKLIVPQNDKELLERIDALLRRFSKPQLSIAQSTPGRLLRYSLIAGADETFLAPDSNARGSDSKLNPNARPMYALGALCWNVPCANRRLMRLVDGRPIPEVGYGFQTQRGEFLAALAFAKIDRNYELRVDDKKFTVQDLVEWEKYSCTSSANLSLVAIGLSHYSQNPDEKWINQFGEEWSLQKILESEAKRPVDWNTADSTDKLLAFSYLLARLKQSARTDSPELAQALQKTESFLITMKRRVLDMLEETGLSESLFFNPEIKLKTPYMKLYVNGRLLRWLSIISSQEELNSPKMKRAHAELCALVDQLFNSLEDLSLTSNTDEESFAIALQTLARSRKLILVGDESSEQEMNQE